MNLKPSLAKARSLFLDRERQLNRLLQRRAKGFLRYERAYWRSSSQPQATVPAFQALRQLRRAEVVLVGDYHTHPPFQAGFLDLLRRGRDRRRPAVLALEFLESRFQRSLEQYLSGALLEAAFLRRIGHSVLGQTDLWPSFRNILLVAQQNSLPVLAIDAKFRQADRLKRRDRHAASRIAFARERWPGAQVFVLIGQYHLAPPHLPRCLNKLGIPRVEVVYQSPERAYFAKPYRRGTWVRFSSGHQGWMNGSPLDAQQSYWDYLGADQWLPG